MNTYSYLFLLLFISSSLNAQNFVFSFSKKEYIPCKITLEDGTVKEGFVKDFSMPNTFEVQGFWNDFKSIESKVKLDKADFKFRETIKGETQKIVLSNIHAITLMEENDTIRYEKLKLKTVNSKSEVIDLEREIMVPLLRKDNINLYGIKVNTCMTKNNCQLMYILAYIKNKNQEFAYIPIDFNNLNLVNTGSIGDKFTRSFEEAGKDCPAFIAWLNESKEMVIDKEMKKDAKQAYKDYQKRKKETIKKIKGRKAKLREGERIDVDYFLASYIAVIEHYKEKCPE